MEILEEEKKSLFNLVAQKEEKISLIRQKEYDDGNILK